MGSEASIDPVPDSAVVVTPPERADEIFLEGPRSRFAEFFTLLRVMRDFLRGFRTLHFVGPCVTVFGSARVKPNDPHYERSEEHTSELQSQSNLVCRLLLEKKKKSSTL